MIDMEEDKYLLFKEQVPKDVFKGFIKLYEIAFNQKAGKLTDNQKEMIVCITKGMKFPEIMEATEKKYVHSVQAGINGAVKNILDGIVDLVWLFQNADVLAWLEDVGNKYYSKNKKKV